MSDSRVLVVRADASESIGAGHVMRCMALADHWKSRGGEVVFVTVPGVQPLEERIRAFGAQVEHVMSPGSALDSHATSEIAGRAEADWVVVDGYHLGAPYIAALRANGFRVLQVDDEGRGIRYEADLVLNQNLGAAEDMYSQRAPHTRLLLGCNYALLRSEFSRWRAWRRDATGPVENLMLTFGGSDPENHTEAVLRALDRVDGSLEIKVLVGPANPHLDALASAAARRPEVHFLKDPADVPSLMASTDVAVAAAGSTVWELAFMMVPSVLVATAPNQEPNVDGLATRGVARRAGLSDLAALATQVRTVLADADLRRSMAEAGRFLVDGLGSARVVDAMKEFA